MNLDLSQEEVNAIIVILGNLPTNTNAWPLQQKVIAQYKAQAPVSSEEEKEAE